MYNITIEKDVITLKIGKFDSRLKKEKPTDDSKQKKKKSICAGIYLDFIKLPTKQSIIKQCKLFLQHINTIITHR